VIAQPIPDTFTAALRDLETRSLGRLTSNFAKLVYLASTRNYNTGHYEHDGLTFHYSKAVAERVLATAHRQVFLDLALSPLDTLTSDLEKYIFAESVAPDRLLTIWNDLEAYRVLVPSQANRLAVRIFRSNLKAALAVVAESWRAALQDPDLLDA
jgi:hypothetical protein